MKIHHIGIVVADLDKALEAFCLTRDNLSETVRDEKQKNTLYFYFQKENDLWLEFIEPWDEKSTTASFAKRFGNSIHHIGFSSNDLNASEEKHQDSEGNFPLGRYDIDIYSFGGKGKTSFYASKGMILEFVQPEPKEK